ncbi:sensor histidine kinase [Ichthyenterobacterium magnum]|uniref:7TM protein involved in diverse intracellular signaling n=1 Tax=Ichthyenterobacterium magnum TaxID=1230530 RepID=A0A420DGS4_9FLAO|nr:histidine kinase [Ichthyenterobacterium magnum]RKE92284.1 7TM protein involved in diverse intracellular signaling [Ichthyenterobacterium magnum]
MIFKLKHTVLLAFTFIVGFTSYTQNTSVIDDYKVVPFTIHITNNPNTSIDSIANSKTIFKQPDTFARNTHPNETYWLRIDFINEFSIIKKDSIWQLQFRNFELASLFSEQNGRIVEKKFGRFNINKEKHSIVQRYDVEFNSNNLIDNRYLYLKLKHVTALDYISRWYITYGNSSYNNSNKTLYTYEDIKTLIPLYIFSGISLVVFLITITFFFYSKRREYLFYATYVLFIFLFLTTDNFGLLDILIDQFGVNNYAIIQIITVLANIFYTLFILFYLNTKLEYPKLYKGLKLLVYINCIIFIIDVFFILFDFYYQHIYILLFQRLITSSFCVIGMIYLLFTTKTKLSYFVIIGTFFYLVGAFSLFFFNNELGMITGACFELLVFSYGLTYKRQLEYNEKIKFQKESFSNKNKALRAQMNPHFIFNSLNSIQYLITKKDNTSALKYLSKFSRFTRNILESSIETDILLSEEIAMLKDYLELESLRFKDVFSYTINVSDDIDPDAIEIPLLVIQPFVENAILHGFINKKIGANSLDINFYKRDGFLICEIDDNGIGRENSKSIKSIRKKRSRGLEVTKERLYLFNQLNNETNNITIVDKKNDDGDSLGTKVIIKILIH